MSGTHGAKKIAGKNGIIVVNVVIMAITNHWISYVLLIDEDVPSLGHREILPESL